MGLLGRTSAFRVGGGDRRHADVRETGVMGEIRYRVVPLGGLTSDEVTAWSALRASDPMLANPFFAVEFARAVASVRSNVEIVVMEVDGKTIGLFPFQREGTAGLPLGTRVAEIQGAIVRPGTRWNPLQMLEAAGLKSWSFDCIPAWQQSLAAFAFCTDRFPYISLRDGFESYRLDRRKAGSRQIQQAQRKGRRLEREHGELRFEMHTVDGAAMQALQRWKSSQYARTGTFDLFRLKWVPELLREVWGTQESGFSGVLSALYAANEIVAVHLGMRSGNVMAWWFPAYNQDYEPYSPGLILLTKMLEAANDTGIERFDFGRGPERYKASFANGSWGISEGLVDARPVHRTMRRAVFRLRDLADGSQWAALPLRYFRRLKQSRAARRGE